MRIFSDRIITVSGELSGCIEWNNGKITSVLPCTNAKAFGTDTLNMSGKIIIPGLIELHSHGGGNHAFINSSPEEVAAGCDFHLSHGTTSILPTVTAGAFSDMARAARNIRAVMENSMSHACILGAHMEGPYLSKVQAGAQCPGFITPPNENEYIPFLEEMHAYIRRWDYAPENDTDCSFLHALTKYGILAAAGHTDATYEQLCPALDGGLSLITHLYSCTSTVTRKNGFRSLGVIETSFLSDQLKVEIIADGKHLPPELIKMIFKIKGRENIALITDSLAIAGTDITEGHMSGTDFIVEDGVCKLKDRSAFAGSVATSDRLLRVLVFDCGISLHDAVYMASTTPANILKMPNKGRIAPNTDADIVIMNPNLTVDSVFVGGEKYK